MDEVVWETGGWRPLPALSGEVSADVAVVGLGGSGLTAVGALLDRGLDVVGLDAGPVAGGAAGRNGGFLLAGLADFHHEAAAALGADRASHLHRLTLAEMDRMGAETPEAIRRPGSLRIATSPEELEDCRAQLAAMRAADLPVEPYDGPEGTGLRFPRDGSLQPLARCRALARRAADRGAALHVHSPAVEIRGGLVRTPTGAVRCGAVVVCVDGGLERLLPELAGRIRTARVQMLATAPTDEVRLPMPVYARYGMDFWQQLPDGRIALGGHRDTGGEDEWTSEAATSPPVQDALEHLLRHDLGVTAPITHRWAGAIGFGDGPLPVLAEVRPRVVAVGGYRGTGNVVGAIWARAAVELALDGRVADPAVHPG
jgi:glycine/D-amino acid oxidase-like deaminating enzyme